MTADQKMRRFIGFIVYAENSVKSHANGRFVPEDFPAGVEAVNCSSLQVSKVRALNSWCSEQRKKCIVMCPVYSAFW